MAGRFIWVEERLGSIPNSPIYYKSSSRPTLGGREESGGFGSRNPSPRLYSRGAWTNKNMILER